MLLDSLLPSTTLLIAAAAPGAHTAPGWFLPMAAAATGLLPVCMLPILKGAETQRQRWEDDAPKASDGHAFHTACFYVDDAGPAKGKGLFTSSFVPRGTYLFDYTGDLLDEEQYHHKYPSRVSDYCAALRNPATGVMHFVDGVDERKGSPSRWMNHADDKPNVGRRSFFPKDGTSPRILMYAIKDLEPGDELMWNYGDGFWAAHAGKV